MPVSPAFRSFVEEQLGAILPIRTRRMFGGVGIYTEDVFFALVADDILYLKVDDLTRQAFEAEGLRPFRPWGPEGAELSYREAPAELLEDPDALAPWVEKAVAAAVRSKER